MHYVAVNQNITLFLKRIIFYLMKIFTTHTSLFLLLLVSVFLYRNNTVMGSNNLKLLSNPWSTFIGGSSEDLSFSHATDKFNNIYVLGYTNSVDFPTTAGTLQTVKQGSYDGFISKLDSSGNLIWSTYFGGLGDEYFNQILIDDDCNIYIVGYTNGNDLMVSPGVFQTTPNGGYDVYVAKLDSSANFIWGTYLGGNGGDIAIKAELDTNQNLIIGGYTSSFDFPTLNSFQNSLAGALDAFVFKMDSTGNLVWSTYCGGTNSEDVHALTVDNQNNVIISGETYSLDFPLSPSPYQSGNAGNADIFIVKYDEMGNRIFSTYFGGINVEDVADLTTDANQNIYLAGYSSSIDFPIVGNNVYQALKNGNKDAILAKFNSNGVLQQSTFVGGSNDDFFNSITINKNNQVYVVGHSLSSNMPLLGTPYQSIHNGFEEGILYRFDTTLTPNYGTYIGGNSADIINHISINKSQKIIFNGTSNSPNFPITPNAYQSNLAGQTDCFVFAADSLSNLTTSINYKNKGVATIKSYPNPFTTHIVIESINSDISQVELKSIDGKVLYSNKLDGNRSVLVIPEHIKKGIYYMFFMSEKKELLQVFPVVKN